MREHYRKAEAAVDEFLYRLADNHWTAAILAVAVVGGCVLVALL